MKKRFKIGLTTMVLSLFVCLSGCGKENVSEKQESSSKTETQQEQKVNGAATYKASKKIKTAKPYEGYVQIKDKVVQLPASYEELKKELDFKLIADETIQSDEFIVDGGDYFNIRVSLDDFGNAIEFYVSNISEERVPLKECQIEEISEFSPNSVFFPGGITLGSSFQDVESVLGDYYTEIENSDTLDYRYLALITDKTIPFFKDSESNKLLEKIPCSNYQYKISFDRNTYTATSIYCVFEKNITQEYIDYTINKDNPFNPFPIKCQKPYGLQVSSSMMTIGSLPGKNGRFKGILSIDDKQYLMVFSSENNDAKQGLGEIYEQYYSLLDETSLNYGGGHRYDVDAFSNLLLLPEDQKILTDTETHITGISYSTNDGYIAAHLVHDLYTVDQGNTVRDYAAFLYPMEGTEISENAVNEFKEIVEHMGSSMTMEYKE